MLESFETALDELSALDPRALADRETIVELHRLVERLTAVVTRVDAAFDAGRAWEDDGARSAAAWLGRRCSMPVADAWRRVRIGRGLRAMPETEAVWLAGEVGKAHVEPLVALRRRVGAAAFDQHEKKLVEYARELPFREFRRAVAYWEQEADPTGWSRPLKRSGTPAASTCRRATKGRGSPRPCWPDFRRDRVPSVAKDRGRAVRRRLDGGAGGQRRGGVRGRPLAARPPNGEPMHWWKWPAGPWPCRPGHACRRRS